jgi:hypothetical protein
MGKTTNNLINAGNFALEGNVGGVLLPLLPYAQSSRACLCALLKMVVGMGRCLLWTWQVFVDSLRTLHISTAQELKMGNDTIAALEGLLDELKVRHTHTHA